MNLAITVGQGKDRPQGRLVALEPPPVDGVAAALLAQPRSAERWWSPHAWERDYRLSDKWRASMGAVIDVDCDELVTKNGKTQKKKRVPSPAAIARLLELVRAGELPGSLFHLTPHGARVVFVYELACTHREMQVAASKGAAALVERVLATAELFDFQIDPCSWDLARYYFTPTSVVDGLAREAEQIVMRAQPYEVDALAAEEPPPEVEPPPTPAKPPGRQAQSFLEAKSRWVADHPREYPRHSAPCPVCEDKASFGHLPDDPSQWYCFSTDHPDGVGRHEQNGPGYHGDALDLEAALRGCTTKEVLFRDGYYQQRTPRPVKSVPAARPTGQTEGLAAIADAPDAMPPADVVPIDRGKRVYRNNSYLTTLQIIEANDRNVLGQGATLRYDEMAGRAMLCGQPVEKNNETAIMAEIERKFVGGIDPEGRQKGMRQSLTYVRDAIEQVAHGRSYHPVREYLQGLTWDGTPRLDSVAEDVLGAERTLLNQALVRRYLVSAVARAMVPGCKVDTALILVGKTGFGKSLFFRILAEPWFIDSQFADVTAPKAMMTIRRAWIYEWAELEVMRRAEDINQVKAWVTSPVDEYVAQYGHNAIQVPRGFVVAGSTESDEFLVDEKGNRRFWPLRVTHEINRSILRAQRDQLWAEAMSIYSAWVAAGADELATPWVLSAEENLALDAIHAEYQTTDSWSDDVLTWAEKQLGEFTTADVLESAIKKPKALRNRGDDMRVAAILKKAHYKLGRKPVGRSKPWIK